MKLFIATNRGFAGSANVFLPPCDSYRIDTPSVESFGDFGALSDLLDRYPNFYTYSGQVNRANVFAATYPFGVQTVLLDRPTFMHYPWYVSVAGNPWGWLRQSEVVNSGGWNAGLPCWWYINPWNFAIDQYAYQIFSVELSNPAGFPKFPELGD